MSSAIAHLPNNPLLPTVRPTSLRSAGRPAAERTVRRAGVAPRRARLEAPTYMRARRPAPGAPCT